MATRPADGRAAPRHPLDPLSADEIRRAVAILRRDRGVGPRWRFGWIELGEPAKQAVGGVAPGESGERAADVVCWSRDDGRAYKARVSLSDDRVVAWEHCPGVQPNFTVDEYNKCNEALKKDPRVIAALARHGIRDMDRVLIDTWAYGGLLVPEKHRDRRVGWTDIWLYDEDGLQPLRQPGDRPALRGRRQHAGAARDRGRRSRAAADDGRVRAEARPGPAPARRRQAAARSSSRTASRSRSTATCWRWQRWSMRLGFNQREGLVLHTVGYEDGGRVRPVAHRLSFAEMVVPYRDPTDDHKARTAFDIGEWGLGFMTTSLELGCDCLGEIAYLDAVLHDSQGEPRTIRNAICIHEEDDAVLWKHVDPGAGAEVRRSRRLVVSFHVTVANYEYLVYWRFYQDGEHRVRGARHRDHGHEQLSRGRAAALRHARRRAHLRAVPPALHRRAPRHGRRRREQHGPHDRVRAAADDAGQPGRARAGPAQRAAAHRAGGHAGLRLGHPARLEGGQRARHQPARHAGRLQARAGRVLPGHAGPRLARLAARAGDGSHAVGHAVRPGRALAVRRVRGPERAGQRAAGVDGAEPLDRGHGRRALVRLRHPPRDPPGGLAGDAGRHRLVLAQAVRVLRPQPGARRAPANGACHPAQRPT